MHRQPRPRLVSKERIVQLLIVDIDLAHLGLDPLPGLGLQFGRILLLFDRVPELHNPCILDKIRQVKGHLFDTALALEVLALLVPVHGDRDGVAVALELDQQVRVRGGHVDPVHDLGVLGHLLQDRDAHPVQPLELLFAGGFLFFGVRGVGSGHVIVGFVGVLCDLLFVVGLGLNVIHMSRKSGGKIKEVSNHRVTVE